MPRKSQKQDASDQQEDLKKFVIPSVAQPRTYQTTEVYVPAKDRTYYRNNGNKHIKSVGF